METNHNLDFPNEEWQQEGNHIGTAATPQQLRILQSLLPNSTKTDARSILEDVSGYLKGIHQEMEQIEKELSKRSEDNGSSSSGRSSSGPSPAPKILRVETEKLGQSRFLEKIISKKGPGVAAQVQRVFESLELDVKLTSLSVQDKNSFEILTTALLQVTKGMPIMTEEELHGLITNGMERLGRIRSALVYCGVGKREEVVKSLYSSSEDDLGCKNPLLPIL